MADTDDGPARRLRLYMDMDHVLSKAELTHSNNDTSPVVPAPDMAPPPDLMLAGGAWLVIMSLLDALLLGLSPLLLGLRLLGLLLLAGWWSRGAGIPRWLPPLWLTITATGQVAATYLWVEAGVGAMAVAAGMVAAFLLLPVAAPLLRGWSRPILPAAVAAEPVRDAVPLPVLRLMADNLNTRLNTAILELEALATGPISPAQAIQLRLLRNEVAGMQALIRQRLGGGLPLDAGKDEPPLVASAMPAPPPAPPRARAMANGLSALVVDDDPVGRTLTRLLLEQAGYAVEDTEDAKMALEMALMEGPDVALIAARIGRHSGLALAWCINRGGGPPVVLLQGRADTVSDRQQQRSGVATTLAKPVTSDGLTAALGPLLSGRQSALPAPTAHPASPSEPPPPETEPVLDARVLEDHLSILGAARLVQIMDSFSRNAPDTLAAVTDAMERGDVAGVGKAAHKLASGALTVGLTVLGRLAKQADSAAKRGDAEATLMAARQFNAAFAAGQAALAGYRRDRLTAGP